MADWRAGRLPAEVTSFVGRRNELTSAKRLLSVSRLVTFTGVGGVGKTRLAVRVAGSVQRAFRDGVYLANLASLKEASLLAETVAEALGLRDQVDRSAMVVMSEYLADRQLLLVLDNCEHLLDACAVLAATLLRGAPQLRILATSRQGLGVDGEHTLQVPPLSAPDPESGLRAEAMAGFDAVNLFTDRARAVRPDFMVDDDNHLAVGRLCHRLDGIPLALELAARRLRVLSVEQVVQRLEERYRLLTEGDRGALPRQKTLRALIDWSFDLCTPDEQTLWSRVSVFAGGFGLDAAEQVCSGDGIDRDAILELIGELVDKSIVTAENNGIHVRYQLLETISQYGHDRLAESGTETTLRRRHRDWYATQVEQAEAGWFGSHQVEWFAYLRREHANLRTAVEFCLTEPGEADMGLRMAVSLWFYWAACGHLGEGHRWLQRALRAETPPDRIRAKALWVDSYVTVLEGDITAAAGVLDDARCLARRLHDSNALAYVDLVAGLIALFGADLSAAARLSGEALGRFRDMTDLIGVRFALGQCAAAASTAGDSGRAIAFFEEAIAMGEACGERWRTSFEMWGLALESWKQGDTRRSTALARDALEIKQSFHDQLGMALCLETLAWTAGTDSDPERAARLLGCADTLWHLHGQPLHGFEYLIGFHDQCAAHARDTLGEQRYQAAFGRGAELGLDEAIPYALDQQRPARPAPSTLLAEPRLTPRELEVAHLVAEGSSNKDIACQLVIAQRTAEAHIEHILAKMGFTSRAQIAAWIARKHTHPAAHT